jgi:hypothetical protein
LKLRTLEIWIGYGIMHGESAVVLLKIYVSSSSSGGRIPQRRGIADIHEMVGVTRDAMNLDLIPSTYIACRMDLLLKAMSTYRLEFQKHLIH